VSALDVSFALAVPVFLEKMLVVEIKDNNIFLKVFGLFTVHIQRRCTGAERFFLGLSR